MRNVSILLIILFLASCEKEYTGKPPVKPLNTIVVDAILTNENISQQIKLSLPLDSLNATPKAVSGAIVTVKDGIQTYTFNESDSIPGTYYSLPFQAVTGITYSLEIIYHAETYTSSASMVPLANDDAYKLIRENGLYKYTQVKTGEPKMIEVTFNWSSVPAYTIKKGKKNAKAIFYILNNIDINKEIGPDKEVILFPAGTQITRKKYSLSTEHQEFLRSLLMETEWRGGIFDVQQGNVITNISNGGWGYFAACTVVVDSFVVE